MIKIEVLKRFKNGKVKFIIHRDDLPGRPIKTDLNIRDYRHFSGNPEWDRLIWSINDCPLLMDSIGYHGYSWIPNPFSAIEVKGW